jgi:DMSO/TMAO reductase YedYZ heme-binding membrane subunit
MTKLNLKQNLKFFIYFQLFILIISFFFISNNYYLLGAWMGKFAIYVFWLIAIAGILQRFKVTGFLKTIQNVLISNRRQLGIIMFVFAFTHYMWSKGFSIILYGIPSSIPLFQIFGFIALVLSFPLLLTSNNYSVKKLGKFWKVLHKLVYPVMFLLILHTSMQGADFQILGLDFGIEYTLSYGIPSLAILILQIYSHYYQSRLKIKQA